MGWTHSCRLSKIDRLTFGFVFSQHLLFATVTSPCYVCCMFLPLAHLPLGCQCAGCHESRLRNARESCAAHAVGAGLQWANLDHGRPQQSNAAHIHWDTPQSDVACSGACRCFSACVGSSACARESVLSNLPSPAPPPQACLLGWSMVCQLHPLDIHPRLSRMFLGANLHAGMCPGICTPSPPLREQCPCQNTTGCCFPQLVESPGQLGFEQPERWLPAAMARGPGTH